VISFYCAILIQSSEDAFDLNKTRQMFTPAEQGMILMKCDQVTELGGKEHTNYQSGVGKLLHKIGWSCPEIYNAV
jgi:hypothetical protein